MPASTNGFKLMYNTLNTYRGLREWIHEKQDLMILHMTRRNLLKSYISRRGMAESHIAHTKSRTLKYRPVFIETKYFQRYIEDTLTARRHYRSIFENRHPALELSYEDMFADRQAFMARIMKFFSLPPEKMKPPAMRKIGISRLRDEVRNPDEVIEFCTGTKYAKYLDDFKI